MNGPNEPSYSMQFVKFFRKEIGPPSMFQTSALSKQPSPDKIAMNN